MYLVHVHVYPPFTRSLPLSPFVEPKEIIITHTTSLLRKHPCILEEPLMQKTATVYVYKYSL